MRVKEDEQIKRYVETIRGRQKLRGVTNAELMEASGIRSATTLSRKMKDPRTMTVGEWMAINKTLGLRAELN